MSNIVKKLRDCTLDEQDCEAMDMDCGDMMNAEEARKSLLIKQHDEPGNSLDQEDKSDFVNKEVSTADLRHSIPCMVDGLKPGQRKIIFCSFKSNFVKDVSVQALTCYVLQHSAYPHALANLPGTIIGMAQDFVGSNNINFLQHKNQIGMGSRNHGGKDHATKSWQIDTCLSPITRFLFREEDDILLDYLKVNGESVEPSWYVPVIPTVLVNGSEGIGTGLSTFIPNYNPRDIVSNLKRLLNGEPMVPMDPWYKGFRGKIEKKTSTKGDYIVTGVIEEGNETTLWISELPVRCWNQDYKEFLDSMMAGNDNNVEEPFIKDYFVHYIDSDTVLIKVILSKDNMEKARREGLVKTFRLSETISTGNMHLFDSEGAIKKYDNPEQILEDFYVVRLGYYQKRKRVVLENLQIELKKLENKVRYISRALEEERILFMENNIAEWLHLEGFDAFPESTRKGESLKPEEDDYEYLLSLPVLDVILAPKKIKELRNEQLKLEGAIEELKHATAESLWRKDLESLEKKLDEQDVNGPKAEEEVRKLIKRKMAEDGTNAAMQAPRGLRKYTKMARTSVPAKKKIVRRRKRKAPAIPMAVPSSRKGKSQVTA